VRESGWLDEEPGKELVFETARLKATRMDEAVSM
jgi:hypothetical protein